jgi:hypothetical protein
MRDLTHDELGHVYGAGSYCAPKKPRKPRKDHSKSKSRSKSKSKSKSKGKKPY